MSNYQERMVSEYRDLVKKINALAALQNSDSAIWADLAPAEKHRVWDQYEGMRLYHNALLARIEAAGLRYLLGDLL